MKSNQILMIGNSIGKGNGYIYNGYAASNANFAPTDWKVPSSSEFNTLITYLGGSTVAGGKLKESGFLHWYGPNTGADNSSNFTAYGSGNRDITGSFNSLKSNGYFWANDSAYYYNTVYNGNNYSASGASSKVGLSIRLLYTGAGTPATVTDYDGNVYNTVVIGTQRWVKQNWKCTRLNNGTSIPNVTDGTTWAGLTTLARCSYLNDDSLI